MQNNLLLQIAFDAINEEFEKHTLVDKEKLLSKLPVLKEKGAVFVTLTKNSELRGCIGSLVATRSLLDDIISHAKNAAFHDPRFLPLQKEELENVKIELSILSEPKPLSYKDEEDLKSKIAPNKHGVILQLNGKSATFLPQVWEQLPQFETFFAHLCQKAGLEADALKLHPEIFTYEVEKITQ